MAGHGAPPRCSPDAALSPGRESRTTAPERPALALIDESHHFRNPATRRYTSVAPWLVHAPVLLASATPVVNRLDDLAHQLLLAVRDDCLAGRGCPSLEALSRGQPLPPSGIWSSAGRLRPRSREPPPPSCATHWAAPRGRCSTASTVCRSHPTGVSLALSGWSFCGRWHRALPRSPAHCAGMSGCCIMRPRLPVPERNSPER